MLNMSMSLILYILLFKMIKSITFSVMQIRVIFVLPSLVPPPSLGALGSCPNRLPLDPALVSISTIYLPKLQESSEFRSAQYLPLYT